MFCGDIRSLGYAKGFMLHITGFVCMHLYGTIGLQSLYAPPPRSPKPQHAGSRYLFVKFFVWDVSGCGAFLLHTKREVMLHSYGRIS